MLPIFIIVLGLIAILAIGAHRHRLGWHVHYDDGKFSDPVSKDRACDLAIVFGGSVHDLRLCGHG